MRHCALVRIVTAPTAGAPARHSATTAVNMPAAPLGAAAVVDGAAFRCADGSLLHVSSCAGESADAVCKPAELHKPGLQLGTPRRADIAARVKGCEAGGIRYGADDKPIFIR